MANEIKLTFAGDATSLDRAFKSAGDSALDFEKDLDKADEGAGRFQRGVGSLNERIDASESKFMGAADLVDGLAGAFGVSLGPTVEYARAFGDMAGGFTATLGPAMESISGKLGKLSAVTKLQTMAQAGLNAVMAANPIFLVIAGLTALTAAFVIAYKKSETFRAIVDGAMGGVKKAVGGMVDAVTGWFDLLMDGFRDVGTVGKKVAETLVLPYKLAFNGIASLWNNSVGKLSFKVPSFVPIMGGKGWDVPDIPMLASGGVATKGMPHIVGERGPELFVPGMTGTVVPNHALGASGTPALVLKADGADLFLRWLRETIRVQSGGDVQKALGTA